MPRHCSCFGCKGNYDGTPYVKVISFPKDPEERERWILAMPNEKESLRRLKEIYICETHFNCEWVSVKGGKRPKQPPSIFPGIPKSALKQVTSAPRPTSSSTSQSRAKKVHAAAEAADKIRDFDQFRAKISSYFPGFNVIKDQKNLYLSRTDATGQTVKQFFHLQQVNSPFGFLFLNRVEKDGIEVPKRLFPLQKNSLLSKWSQIRSITEQVNTYEYTSQESLQYIISQLCKMTEAHELPHLTFILSQLRLVFKPPDGRRFHTDTLIFAMQLHNISPSAYKMIRRSGLIILPSTKKIKEVLSSSLQDSNLKTLFDQLKPQQRLVNLMFDEVKLIETLRFSGGHVLGYAQNVAAGSDHEMLASHAMVVEVACHFGGPRYILRVLPCKKLAADKLSELLTEAASAVVGAGGTVISLICDNCNTNRSVYSKLGGPGSCQVLSIQEQSMFLVYDYVHIFKNVRNNWITVDGQTLSFLVHGNEYKAYWSDIRKLYEIDRATPIRLTKLTHTAVFPKRLQRQSVPLVCQVFNDKTVAALKTFKDSLGISEGTIILTQTMSEWFKMMNVKDRFSARHLRDESRQPWTADCTSFTKLEDACQIISTCTWQGGSGRKLKLTKQTAEAFIVSTRNNVAAAKLLLAEKDFDYVLPAIFADEALEKFFGQARQRSGGNFYIDVVDIMAAAKVTNLQTLLKHDIMPESSSRVLDCDKNCTSSINPDERSELIDEITPQDTRELLRSADNLKHKVVYLAGYLVHKYCNSTSMEDIMDDEDGNEVSSEFLDHLNRGGLSVPTISTVFFVHNAYNLHAMTKMHCRFHFAELLSFVDAPLATNNAACTTLANILLKAQVLNVSDKEKAVRCLRRQEKLSI